MTISNKDASFPQTTSDTVGSKDKSSSDLRVLIADDEPTSRKIYSSVLEKKGYLTHQAVDGDEAWRVISSDDPPHIALIDWVMPGKTGIELCKEIKALSNVFIYTIIVTGKNRKEDVITGLNAGAHEFLSKPIDTAELVCRVAAGARIVHYERELKESKKSIETYAEQMEMLANNRAKQLMHTERIATLGAMSAGLVHELNNPITYIYSNARTLSRMWSKIDHFIQENTKNKSELDSRLSHVQRDVPRLITGLLEGSERILEIAQSLSRFAHHDSGKKDHIKLAKCIQEALIVSNNTWKYNTDVEVDIMESPEILVNEQEIVQVLVNLVVNASDAIRDTYPSGKRGKVKIQLEQHDDIQRIVVEDNGPGIPEQIINNIWNPFFTTKGSGEGTGLGLSISKNIITAHGGKVAVENQVEGGTRFTIDLPQN